MSSHTGTPDDIPAGTSTGVPAQVTAAVVSAFKAPWTSREHVPGTRNPREYIETVHIPSGANATMVVEPASDGGNHIRSLTFDEVLAVAYPIIVAHVTAAPSVADHTLTSGAVAHRPGVDEVLAELTAQAITTSDPALAFAIDALRTVHNLYPGADAISATGTWQAQARTDIHNAIVDTAVRYVDDAADEATDGAEPRSNDPLRAWTVEVFEPAADPGGFCGTYTVTATTADLAAAAAVAAAEAAWGPTTGLAVLAVEPRAD